MEGHLLPLVGRGLVYLRCKIENVEPPAFTYDLLVISLTILFMVSYVGNSIEYGILLSS